MNLLTDQIADDKFDLTDVLALEDDRFLKSFEELAKANEEKESSKLKDWVLEVVLRNPVIELD